MNKINAATRLDVIGRLVCKYGELRYSKDYIGLASDIKQTTNRGISHATLHRFVKGNTIPNLYTLDVIAQYLGFENWDAYEIILN